MRPSAPTAAVVLLSCPQTVVTATTAAAAWPWAQDASRTRVRDQRRTTSLVTGFCDGSGMGHLLGYARVSTTDSNHSSRSTPSPRLAATGSSPRRPAAPAPIARSAWLAEFQERAVLRRTVDRVSNWCSILWVGGDVARPGLGWPIAAPLDRCAELLGVDLASLGEVAAKVEPYTRADGTSIWSLMQLERHLRPEAYRRRRGGYLDRRRIPAADR
jgi:hypothetical protein